jgi:polar amino acid transport system substrate-binding protein
MWSKYWLIVGFLGLLICRGVSQDLKPTADTRRVLAPTGTLRVGLYVGNPGSLVKEPPTDQARGVGFELGREFARWLGVPFEPVVYPNNGAMLEGIRSGRLDVLFTNATPARAKEIDFTQPYIEVEAGFLVPKGSRIAKFEDVDASGVRVGVMDGSTSAVALPALLKNASVVPVPTIDGVREGLSAGTLDAFATNKSILFEVSDSLPGATVLAGRYGVEQLALGIPKGRDAGLPYARGFVAEAVNGGLVKAAMERAGLRGGTVKR